MSNIQRIFYRFITATKCSTFPISLHFWSCFHRGSCLKKFLPVIISVFLNRMLIWYSVSLQFYYQILSVDYKSLRFLPFDFLEVLYFRIPMVQFLHNKLYSSGGLRNFIWKTASYNFFQTILLVFSLVILWLIVYVIIKRFYEGMEENMDVEFTTINHDSLLRPWLRTRVIREQSTQPRILNNVWRYFCSSQLKAAIYLVSRKQRCSYPIMH